MNESREIKPFAKKKWNSFEEMRRDLIAEGILQSSSSREIAIHPGKPSLTEDLAKIIEDTQQATSAKDFFDATCRLSLLLETLNEDSLREIFDSTNLYVLLLNAVFRNASFYQSLIRVAEEEVGIFGKQLDETNTDTKIFLNAGISLAFFSIAIGLPVLKDANISFLRRNLTDVTKYILRNSSGKINFSNLCFKLESISWNKNFNYTGKFPVELNGPKLFSTLRVARSISGISFLSLTINSSLSDQFTRILEVIDTEDFSLSKALSGVYGVIYKIEESEKSYRDGFPDQTTEALKVFFEIFIRNNERNLLYFLKKLSANFHFQEDKKFYQVVLEKIKSAERLRQELISFAQENLGAFEGSLGEERYEWSNKIFIASLRLLSVLSGISKAKDPRWQVSTAVYEYREWIKDVNSILNKYSIEDDWTSIQNYVDQETTEIEWKSSFFTPTEQPFISFETDVGIGKKLFEKIVRTILAMMNTSGGVLIIGLIENPELVARPEVLEKVIYKNNKAFFDTESELKKAGKSLDAIRLQTLDALKSITGNSSEKFNNLISFMPVTLRSGQSTATIVKIQIEKADRQFYNVERKGESIWISLTMRAQGQTVDVDVRDYV